MRIALFITCLADAMFPDVGRATTTLLRRLGHEVVFDADQVCCGQMHVNTGYQAEALPMVERFADLYAEADLVVAPSGSCVGSVRHQHPLVADRFGSRSLQRQTRKAAEHTYELSELLVDVLGVTDVGAHFPHRVTYHPTCHSLRMLRVGDKPLQLLRAVDAIDLVELPGADQCCGFGGTFAVKNADTSTAMLVDKMRAVLDTGAEFCTAGDSSCLMHIGGGLSRARAGARTIHLAQILASTAEDPFQPDVAPGSVTADAPVVAAPRRSGGVA
ncbi:(Fe-S)-binding protein [Auraticoccus sp. F435]|uniref:(Fe-S)-binding protein n=1 Tax=Auraticoccus cholistanensis TaxID=2656650 RepID=A0A6A9UVY7_9ACTN|nr:(Fe-S)-binding protein [Auraticoccus cholistanensis]MVA77076.1 (Fe-S)-binding protein [Auraticoccus cholistanensis]